MPPITITEMEIKGKIASMESLLAQYAFKNQQLQADLFNLSMKVISVERSTALHDIKGPQEPTHTYFETFPWSKVRLGYVIKAGKVTINAGAMNHGEKAPILCGDTDLTFGTGTWYAYGEYNGSTLVIKGDSTAQPQSTSNLYRKWLFTFVVDSAGGIVRDMINNIGDLELPSTYEF